uniref:Uncharacterized protein n=1 Tax=Fagus sylvatica TaxID=28930 RepID=A0A2N9J6V6_FAGSY
MVEVHNDETSADPPTTSIERQMQVITTSIQDLPRETTRQNKELWYAIRKGPPTPHDDNQPSLQKENRIDDQETDSQQVTRHKDDEVQKTPSPNRYREESASSFAHPSRQRPDRFVRLSKQPDRSARSSRGPDDKTARLEEELHEMKKQMGDMKNSLKAKAAHNLDNLVHRADSPFIPRIANFPLPS